MQRSRYSSCCLVNFIGINKFHWIQVKEKRMKGKKKHKPKSDVKYTTSNKKMIYANSFLIGANYI